MLTNFKSHVESKLGSKVENLELMAAIEMAKSDVVSNRLIMGQDVTVQEFEDVIVRCLEVRGDNNCYR